MPVEIPYTFIAGTKAKAKEVNDNFNALAIFVDQLELSNAELEVLVNQISATKADLNGDAGNRFQVADAIGNYDAINKHTFTNLTQNTKDTVSGFVISKQGNTSVNCTPGACWDSTYTAMISSSTSLVKDQSNLSANATYYVYVTSDKETGNCELVISLSNAEPELPTGYEYFRRLGYIKTDDNGYIDLVVSENDFANSGDLSELKATTPGFPSGNVLTNSTSWTATENAWVFATWKGSNCNSTLAIDGRTIFSGTSGTDRTTSEKISFPIMEGHSFALSGSSPSCTVVKMIN